MPNAKNGQPRDIILIGGSAGALDSLKLLLRHLPAGLPAAIFVAIHLAPQSPSALPLILSKAGELPAEHPLNGEEIRHGMIYVAPPDAHLLIRDGSIEVSRGPRENRHRPAIDPLFRTAAYSFGPRVVAVVLSGYGDDGSAGLMAVRMLGGLAIVQNPAEAMHPTMPESAERYAGTDFVLDAAQIGEKLIQLSQNHTSQKSVVEQTAVANDIEEKDKASLETDPNQNRNGHPSVFSCPECGGVLWEMHEGKLQRFRCRVGHAYTAAALGDALSETTEDALWAAMRAMDEKADIMRRVAAISNDPRARRIMEDAKTYEAHARTIRGMLIQDERREETDRKEEESQPAPPLRMGTARRRGARKARRAEKKTA